MSALCSFTLLTESTSQILPHPGCSETFRDHAIQAGYFHEDSAPASNGGRLVGSSATKIAFPDNFNVFLTSPDVFLFYGAEHCGQFWHISNPGTSDMGLVDGE